VIENKSKNTPEIESMVKEFGKLGRIERYYQFSENITGNAYDIVINNELDRIRKSELVLITDGDLISNSKEWLSEEIHILSWNKEVFACGITLDTVNLPLEAFPESEQWIHKDIAEHEDYFEVRTGGHLLLLRSKDFHKFMLWKNAKNLNFVDGVMHRYCYDEVKMTWARTKYAKAYHLTWDLYSDRNHPYTKLKTSKSFHETWYHMRKASYKLTEF
jgi:hypothetical protein